MRIRIRFVLTALVALVASLVPLGPTEAVGAALAGTGPAGAAALSRTSPVTSVVLPSGQRVHVQVSDGQLQVRQVPGDPQLVVNRVGGHVYAVPVGTLGTRPDLRSYDLTALLDPALRAELARPASLQPHFPQVTMVLRLQLPTDPAPDAVYATVVNTDDSRRYGQTVLVAEGQARLSVPKGHYSVIVVGQTGRRTQVVRMAFAVDQDVETDGTVVRVDLAAARADGFPTYDTGSSLAVRQQLQYYEIQDERGSTNAGDWEIFGGHGLTFLVAAQAGGQHGSIASVNSTVESATGGAPAKPIYYLTRGHPNGVVPDEQVAAGPADLATVHASYNTDGNTGSGIVGRSPVFPYFDPGMIAFLGLRLPLTRTEYLLAPAGVLWFTDAEASSDSGGFSDVSGFDSFTAGSDQPEDFWRGPLAPGVADRPPGSRTYPFDTRRACFVCRNGTRMSVGLAPLTDTTATHGGALFAAPGERPQETHVSVYLDGAEVASESNSADNPFAYLPFDVPADSHAYRIVETAHRAVDGMALSTRATTDYRFTSSATSGARLGPDWDCAVYSPSGCSVLPLLRVRVPLPTSLTGTLPTGYSFLIVDVDHVQGAAPSDIRSFDLATSTPGSGFVPQLVTALGGGRYYVAIRNQAPAGTPITLRWQATDAADSSITQTVAAAYRVARSGG